MRVRTNYALLKDRRKNVVINGVIIKEQHPTGLRKTCRMSRNVVIYDIVISGVECMAEIGKLSGPKNMSDVLKIVIPGVIITGVHCIWIFC